MKLTATQSKSTQIAEIIRKEIISGRLRPGERLDSARQLAEHFGVGRQVLRSAFKILENENLVRTVLGSGAFIRDYIPPAPPEEKRVMVGFVSWHDTLAEKFPLRVYQTLLAQSNRKNCDIFLSNTDQETELIHWVRNYHLDGLILSGYIDDSLIQRLNDEGILFLLLGNYQLKEEVNRLEKDVFNNIRTGMSSVIKKYRFSRIACIFGTMFGLGPQQTLAGIKAAAAENGLAFDDAMFRHTENENGYAAMEYLFQHHNIRKNDLVYLVQETFSGAARSIFERGIGPEHRPYLFLDMPESTLPYPDLVGCFLYQTNDLAEEALDSFLNLYYGKVPRPWCGRVNSKINRIS